jgi:hypothetical protein
MFSQEFQPVPIGGGYTRVCNACAISVRIQPNTTFCAIRDQLSPSFYRDDVDSTPTTHPNFLFLNQ